MKRDIIMSNQFRKDLKMAKKRGYNLSFLEEVVNILARGKELPERNRDHCLSGNLDGFRECHILSDWLLIYRIEDEQLLLFLSRTGTHSDLF